MRPPRLTQEQRESLEAILQKSPGASGWPEAKRWTGEALARYVGQRWNVILSVRQSQRLLQELKPSRPRRKEPVARPAKVPVDIRAIWERKEQTAQARKMVSRIIQTGEVMEAIRLLEWKNGEPPSIGRNQLCPCGSGLKFKRCCLPDHERINAHLTKNGGEILKSLPEPGLKNGIPGLY